MGLLNWGGGGGILAQFCLSGRDNSTIRKLSKITHQMCLSNTLDFVFPYLNTQTRFEKGEFAGDIHFYTGFCKCIYIYIYIYLLIYKKHNHKHIFVFEEVLNFLELLP